VLAYPFFTCRGREHVGGFRTGPKRRDVGVEDDDINALLGRTGFDAEFGLAVLRFVPILTDSNELGSRTRMSGGRRRGLLYVPSPAKCPLA
jgi:hypothetical protein